MIQDNFYYTKVYLWMVFSKTVGQMDDEKHRIKWE